MGDDRLPRLHAGLGELGAEAGLVKEPTVRVD